MPANDAARRVTLAQVAQRAGVSTMTASYAYNRPARVSAPARERVFAAARALGYGGPDPTARSLRGGTTGSVGVVLGEHLTYAFEDPQAATFLAGIADVCAERGIGMTILPVTDTTTDSDRLHAAAVDGFILWTTADDAPIIAAARATQRPVVIHGGPAGAGAPVVSIDNRAAARAVAHIAFRDAARPAVLSFPLSPQRAASAGPLDELDAVTFPVTRERLLGFRDAADDLGTPWKDVLAIVCPVNNAAESRTQVAEILAGPQPPDAIAAMSDELAAGAIRAARSHGLPVPDGLSVTGWDDAAVATQLGITTVVQSLRDQGAACARAVLDRTTSDWSTAWSIVHRTSSRTFDGSSAT